MQEEKKMRFEKYIYQFIKGNDPGKSTDRDGVGYEIAHEEHNFRFSAPPCIGERGSESL
jgi:hypothetical protein